MSIFRATIKKVAPEQIALLKNIEEMMATIGVGMDDTLIIKMFTGSMEVHMKPNNLMYLDPEMYGLPYYDKNIWHKVIKCQKLFDCLYGMMHDGLLKISNPPLEWCRKGMWDCNYCSDCINFSVRTHVGDDGWELHRRMDDGGAIITGTNCTAIINPKRI